MKKNIFLIACCIMHANIYAQSWLTAGNTGSSSITNFIGTTDNQALVLRTNNAERMRIVGTGNIGIGTNSPLQKLDINGNINIRSGFSLLMENHRVLKIDSVNGSVFLGNGVALNNTTGFDNTAIGYNSLFYNSTGFSNTATGHSSLFSNTIGQANTASGVSALYSNSTGNYNTANGYDALYSNSSGYANTASGYTSLASNSTGVENTAYGMRSLYGNSTGGYNIAIGNNALTFNSTGSYNTATGTQALQNNTNAYYNCAFGYQALFNTVTGWNNTAIGSFAGPAPGLADVYNTIALGDEVVTTASNQARIGNRFTTSIGGYANWTNISDGRVKKNIQKNVPGLTFINKLKPVTYNLDLDAADRIVQAAVRKDREGKTIPLSTLELNARNAKQQIVYTGFVAQDVETAAKELNYDFSGVDAAKSNKDLYGLRYAEFVVPLVKAVQELSKDNEDLKSTLSDLVTQLAAIKKQLGELEIAKSTGTQMPAGESSTGIARLEQNAPNPFSSATVISYYIPSGASLASLSISNISGQILKTILLNSKGAGKTSIAAGELAAGDYFYTLFINGKTIETKKMIITK